MINRDFKRLFSFWLFAFWLWSDHGLAAQASNYKLVPNLQQMSDRSPTPDLRLPEGQLIKALLEEKKK